MFIDVLIRKVKRENVPFSRPCPLGDKNAPDKDFLFVFNMDFSLSAIIFATANFH